MSAIYRLVHFVPDPFVESRVPIAALVTDNGQLSVVRARTVPSARCLGGSAQAAVVQMILEDLSRGVASQNHLPSSLGPHAVLGTERTVPASVGDAIQWVTQLVQHRGDDDQSEKRYRGPQRATLGYRFFQTYRIDRFVRKTFDPLNDADGLLQQAKLFGTVSHFVDGRDDLLLMEPIVTTRENFDHELTEVGKLFGAYRSIMHPNARKRAQLVAYVLDGGSSDSRQRAIEELRPHADLVIDTSIEAMRSKLIGQIKNVAATETGPLHS